MPRKKPNSRTLLAYHDAGHRLDQEVGFSILAHDDFDRSLALNYWHDWSEVIQSLTSFTPG